MVSVVKLIDNPVSLSLSLADSINFRGEYDELITYDLADSVSFNGSSYVAIQPTTGNLPTNNTFWQLLAEKGETGDQGLQGESGGIFEHVLSGETFVIQERTQVILIGKLRNEGKITIYGRLILRN